MDAKKLIKTENIVIFVKVVFIMEKNIKDALKLKDVNYHQMKKDVMNAMKNMF